MKKLSIIIPFHQYKHYLKECFASLKDSAFQEFEVILVLDHIQEDISDLVEEYSKIWDMKVCELQDGNGVAAARNLGIAQANGEYICFIDSDDYLHDETLSLLMENNKEDVIYGTLRNSWNNKANYLDKREKKRIEKEALDMEDDEEEKEARKQQAIDTFLSSMIKQETEVKNLAIYYLLHRRKDFSQISALGNLYRTVFIKENNITFDESFTYFSDILFLVQVIQRATTFKYCEEAYYVRRRHNDPINYPALSQLQDDERFYERIRVVEEVRKILPESSHMRYIIDMKLVNYYAYKFTRSLRRSTDEKWRNEFFEPLSDAIAASCPEVLHQLRKWKKRVTKSLIDKDLNKVLKQVRFRLAIVKFKKMLKNKNVFYKTAYYHIFLKQSILEDVVLFESFMGKNYSDSPKYIYEYLAKTYPGKYKCIWVLNNKTKPPYGAKKVRRFSFRYAYYLARSKYLVFNVRQPLWYRKREGQVFLETWHGTPLKRLVFDQEEVTAASPKYKKEFYKQRSDWDYLVSANDFSTETLARCFMFENEMLDYGYPRNDILYNDNNEEKIKALKNKLHIPLDKKTILYAPTWRDDDHFAKGKYHFELKLNLKLMKEKLSDEYVVLLRTHHYIADALDTSGLEGFTYNLSKYDDISEIYLISDICITDYSSVFFDYANLKRPILFYTYDIEKYKNQLRGFYIDMESEVPGPLLYTTEEVVDAILHIEDINEEYKERYDTFYKRFCHIDDGNASKRIVEKVFLNK